MTENSQKPENTEIQSTQNSVELRDGVETVAAMIPRPALVERLRAYRPTNEWGEGVRHAIVDEAADAIEEYLELLRECADFVQPFNRAEELLDRIDAAIAKATAHQANELRGIDGDV